MNKIDFNYWYLSEPKDPDNSWGPEFDYDKYDDNLDLYPAREFAGDVVRFWTQEYHIDGLRIDAVKQIRNPEFLGWLMGEANRVAAGKPFYTVGEHIPDTPEIVGEGGFVEGCWHDSFYHTVVPQLSGMGADASALKTVIDPSGQGYTGTTQVVNYLSNHDQDHFLATMGESKIFGDAAFQRARLGAVLTMTAVGVPLIWMGEEFGEYKPKTIEKNPLEWSLLENEANRDLQTYYKGLIKLRKENPALATTNISFFHEDDDAGVLAYSRYDGEGSQVVVVLNLSDSDLEDYDMPWPETGNWHEWTIDYDVSVEGERYTLELPAHEARVFVR